MEVVAAPSQAGTQRQARLQEREVPDYGADQSHPSQDVPRRRNQQDQSHRHSHNKQLTAL